MSADSVRAARRSRNFSRELAERGRYHSLALPDGRVIDGVIGLDHLKFRLQGFGLPQDLRGKRALDIGAWDGWYSFELERRGADVVAVDCVEIENFLRAREMLGSKVDYRIIDLFDLSPDTLGRFDVVLLLGVLYHLRHPLLGLETVCRLTRDVAIVESFVAGQGADENHGDLPYMEFYESDELGGQLDNWFGPTVDCLLGLCRAAGFARVELRGVYDQCACVACYRKWEPEPQAPHHPPPILISVINCRDGGINFTGRRDEYLACVFQCEQTDLRREDIRVQVGPYGTAPLWLGRPQADSWQANCLLPPGIEAGEHEVRVRTSQSRFSNAFPVAVGLALEAVELIVSEVCDGISWEKRRIQSGFASFWISGLPRHADRNNVQVYLAGARLPVEFLSDADATGIRQVNVALRRGFPDGEHPFLVRFGRTETTPIAVEISQAPPGGQPKG